MAPEPGKKSGQKGPGMLECSMFLEIIQFFDIIYLYIYKIILVIKILKLLCSSVAHPPPTRHGYGLPPPSCGPAVAVDGCDCRLMES